MTLKTAFALLHAQGYRGVLRNDHLHATCVEHEDERHICCVDALPTLSETSFGQLVTQVFAFPSYTLAPRFVRPARDETRWGRS